MKFRDSIQDTAITMLMDSGSSNYFISEKVACQLQGVFPVQRPISVQVAGGGLLQCSSELKNASWSIGSVSFQSDLKILPLAAYDLIIGMDWLESFSPMHVHWQQKWLAIPYDSNTVVLQGLAPDFPKGVLMQLCSITEEGSPEPSNFLLPAEVQALVDQFAELFEDSPVLKDEIEKLVADMLSKGIIQPSVSLFSSPVLLVKKKDGSYIFCVDFRHLNALTLKSINPVPIFDQLMDELAKAKWFTNLDLWASFHQIRLKPGEEYKTAFGTHIGHFEFRVVAFGLIGAPGTFQGAMDVTLAPDLRKFVIVFFDDILIYNQTHEEHLVHLQLVFEWLAKDSWKIKLSECKFAQQSFCYLGHIISGAGLATDPSKVQAMVNWPTPTSVKELISFLGLAGYYRKFVKNFGIITRPLTNLPKKNILFILTPDHEEAFQILKVALSSAPVLALPDFFLPFHIETDACGTGVGAVLMQNGHPLAFLSKSLGPRNQGLSAYEKDYMAILIAVDHWRHYLQQGEFFIHTDQHNLVHLNEQRLHTMWQQKVFTKLLGLQYKIIYKKGSDNRVADALSRCPQSEQVLAISSSSPLWLEEVTAAYSQDSTASDLVAKLSVNPNSVPHFSFNHGVLRYKELLRLCNPKYLRLFMPARWEGTLACLSLTSV